MHHAVVNRKPYGGTTGGFPIGLRPAAYRMYTVGANGVRLGRGERGAYRTARNHSRGVRGSLCEWADGDRSPGTEARDPQAVPRGNRRGEAIDIRDHRT